MRDRLIKLLKRMSCVYATCDRECGECHNVEMYDDSIESIADRLLDNGVIVPPCKVGDITYIFDYETNNHLEPKLRGITPSVVEAITIVDDGLWIENEHAKYHISSVGDLIFLAREEAEKALATMKGGE